MIFAFVSLALAMVAVASLFVAWPLWRSGPASEGGTAVSPPSKPAAIGLAGLLSVGAIGLYVAVGHPDAWRRPALLRPVKDGLARVEAAPGISSGLTGKEASPAEGDVGKEVGQVGDEPGPAQIEAMVAGLARRLEAQPGDAAGWRMLARSYETLRRFDEAAAAYRRLAALQPSDADVLVDQAVALGMSQGQTLAGEPEALLNQALELDSRHPQALALSGSAAFERRDYRRAIAQWQKLLAHVPPEAEMRAVIQANIDKANALRAAGR